MKKAYVVLAVFFLAIILPSLPVLSQNLFSPEPAVVCPDRDMYHVGGNEATWFSLNYPKGGCTYTWVATNGTFPAQSGGTVTDNGKKISGPGLISVYVKWDNVFLDAQGNMPKGILTATTNNCSSASDNSITSTHSKILIKSLYGVTPSTMNVQGNLAYGSTSQVVFSIDKLQYKNSGTTDT